MYDKQQQSGSLLPDADKKRPTRAFKDATPLLENEPALRERADKDGYLFFKGLLPKKRLLALRERMLKVLDDWKLLDGTRGLADGIADPEAVGQLTFQKNGYGVPHELYKDIQKLEPFQAILHEPALLRMFAKLFGEAPFPHPKTIARIVLPHKDVYTTPSHQDYIHIQGTQSTWTAWFPVGNCPIELGGLAMLEGSHKQGVIEVAPQDGAGGVESILCGLDYEWAAGDYEIGDVVIFHSLTVHKALPNQRGNQVRLSCDFRYQPASMVIDPRSLQPHLPCDWEEIYAGWDDDPQGLKYFWKTKRFAFSEWSEKLHWQKEKIC